MQTRKRWIMGGVIALLLVLALIGRPHLTPSTDEEFTAGDDYIAVIRVDGPIVGGGGDIPGLLGAGAVATSEQLMKDVRRATSCASTARAARQRRHRRSAMNSTA